MMSTPSKMYKILGFAILVLIAFLVTAYFQLSHIENNVVKIINSSHSQSRNLYKIANAYHRTIESFHDSILYKTPITAGLISEKQKSFQNLIKLEITREENPLEKKYLETLTSYYNKLVTQIQNAIQSQKTINHATLAQIDRLDTNARELIDLTLSSNERRLPVELVHREKAALHDSISWLFLMALTTILFMFMTMIYAFRHIFVPLQVINESLAEQISSNNPKPNLARETKLEINSLAETIMERIHYLSHYDHESDLPNQRLFHLLLNQKFSKHSEKPWAHITPLQHPWMIMRLQITNYQQLQNLYEPARMGKFIVELANKLKTELPKDSLLARSKENQLLLGIPLSAKMDFSEQALTIAKSLLESREHFSTFQEKNNPINMAVGISFYPIHGEFSHQLFANSSHALHAAIESKQPIMIFEPPHSKIYSNPQLNDLFLEALKNNQFSLVYQPQFDIRNNRMTGVEALLRWTHKEFGEIPPEQILQLAEELQQMDQLSAWVLRHVCHQIQLWQQQDVLIDRVAINLSSDIFSNPHLIDLTESLLTEFDIQPRHLEFEITETKILDDFKTASQVMMKLHDIGVRIALDDFGTGYSSFSYLKNFPINLIKIDKSFIEDLEENKHSQIIVSSIIQLARDMNLRVIAEGVEEGAQMIFLKEHACYEVQGNMLCGPVAPEKIVALLK